jgi:ferredoxin
MEPANVLFLFVLVVAVACFSFSAQRLYRFLRIGKDEPRWNDIGRRTWNLLSIGIAQRKILRDSVAGPLHAVVFWGFVVLTAGSIEILASGVFPSLAFENWLPSGPYGLFVLSQEAFALFVLVAVSVLLYRRIVVKPARLQGDKVHSGDAILILSMIAGLMITLILMSAFDRVLAPRLPMALQPVSGPVAVAFGWISPGAAQTARDANWWAHSLLILAFLNYLPYSKHLHVIVSLPNTFLSNTSGPGIIGAMKSMDLEAETEQFGASDVMHLTWKNLLDGYSCTECGRCTSVCPANITGKPLSPRKIVINTRERLSEVAPRSSAEGTLSPASVGAAHPSPQTGGDSPTRSSAKKSSGHARHAAPASTSARYRSTSSKSSMSCDAGWSSPSRAFPRRSSQRSSRSNGTGPHGRFSRPIVPVGRTAWISRPWDWRPEANRRSCSGWDAWGRSMIAPKDVAFARI